MPLTDAERRRIDMLLGTSAPQGLSATERQRIDSLIEPESQTQDADKEDGFFATLGRALSNVPGDIAPTVGEEFSAFGQLVSDPIGAAKGIYNVGEGVVDIVSGDDTPEAQMARQAGRQFVDEVKDFEERPVRSAVNLAALGSALFTGGAGLAGRAPKAASIMSRAGRALDMVDPVAATARVGAGAVKLPFKAASKATEKIADVAADASSAGKVGLLGQVFDSALGFTTGTSGTALQKVREFAASDKGDVMREFRKDTEKGRLRVVNKYIEDYRKIKEAADKDYEAAKQAMIDDEVWNIRIGQTDMDALARLRQAVNEPLRRFGVNVKVDAKGNASVDFPYGTATVAADSRKKIEKALSEIIGPDLSKLEGGIDVGYVDKLKKQLGDELSSISALKKTSKQARAALTSVQQNLADLLNDVTGQRYDELTRPYREKMEALEAADDFFSIRPSDVVNVSELQSKSGGYGRLAQALRDRSDTYATLQQFEKIAADAGGSGNLIASLTGTVFNPLFGSGLVVKSELSQLGRAIVGFELLLGAIPALAVFSPRAVAEITQQLVSAGVPLPRARATASGVVSTFGQINDKINKTLPGDLTFRGAVREGITLGQLIERLTEDAELSQQLEER